MRRAILAVCLLLPPAHRAAEPEAAPYAQDAQGAPSAPSAPAAPAGKDPTPPRDADPGCVPGKLVLGPESRTFEGTVSVKFQVARNGSLSAVKVLSGDPPPAVAQAIEAAVRACRWIPGTDSNGERVAADMTVSVNIKVDKAKAKAPEPAATP